MNKSSKTVITNPVNKETFGLREPKLFEIPLYDYADELNRKRNKKLYHKVKLLEKTSQDLREELKLYLERHNELLQRSMQLVTASLSVNYTILKRKTE